MYVCRDLSAMRPSVVVRSMGRDLVEYEPSTFVYAKVCPMHSYASLVPVCL
jgi:hypothetical protein